jgi:hypothetical protein
MRFLEECLFFLPVQAPNQAQSQFPKTEADHICVSRKAKAFLLTPPHAER